MPTLVCYTVVRNSATRGRQAQKSIFGRNFGKKLYVIKVLENVKCKLFYVIHVPRILPLGGVRAKNVKLGLGQILEKSLFNKTFRKCKMPVFLFYTCTPNSDARGRFTAKTENR